MITAKNFDIPNEYDQSGYFLKKKLSFLGLFCDFFRKIIS